MTIDKKVGDENIKLPDFNDQKVLADFCERMQSGPRPGGVKNASYEIVVGPNGGVRPFPGPKIGPQYPGATWPTPKEKKNYK